MDAPYPPDVTSNQSITRSTSIELVPWKSQLRGQQKLPPLPYRKVY